MSNEAYKHEAKKMIEIVEYVKHYWDESEIEDISNEGIVTLSVAVYNSLINQRTSKESTEKWNIPKGQVTDKEGIYCISCGKKLKKSKSMDWWFCDCWINNK